MHMEESASLNITIHDDFCANVKNDDINAILAAVTALISEAVFRGKSEAA